MSAEDQLAPFAGVWWLDAESCDLGPEVQRSVYTLLFDGEHVHRHTRSCRSGEIFERSDRAALASSGAAAELAFQPEEDGFTLIARPPDAASSRSRHRLAGDQLLVEVGPLDSDEVQRWVFRRTRTKQVMLYRRDLKMRKGKIAAQCAHASMAVFFRRNRGGPESLDIPLDGPMAEWSARRFAKVVLSVEGEAELLAAHELAQQHGLPTAVITDSGRTEFHGVPTRTATAIGPAAREEIDLITGPEGLVATKLA